MELNLEKIKPFSAITLFFAIFTVVIPGFLFLFVFKRDFFLYTDLFRLSVIAMSLTLPIILMNGVFSLKSESRDNASFESEEEFHFIINGTIYYAAALSTPVFYLTILSGYLLNFTIKQALVVTLIAEIVVIIFLYFDGKPKGNEDRK